MVLLIPEVMVYEAGPFFQDQSFPTVTFWYKGQGESTGFLRPGQHCHTQVLFS